ncbi:MAG: porin family protein [Alphaproteobacteria bacterium]|nr:porin family protein [Alphaproteobacteria bacterium]
MKKILATTASALVLSLAVSGVAEARDGFYVAVRGGYSDYNLNDKDDSSADSARIELSSTWHVSGAVGYKYKYFRVEGEYIHRKDADDTYKDGAYSEYKADIKSGSWMLNAYFDLMPNYWISPYVAGGIGITNLEVEHENTAGSYRKSWDEDNFTWMVGAGLSLRINRCLNLDFGYRYMDMKEITYGEFTAHEWYGGLRYSF